MTKRLLGGLRLCKLFGILQRAASLCFIVDNLSVMLHSNVKKANKIVTGIAMAAFSTGQCGGEYPHHGNLSTLTEEEVMPLNRSRRWMSPILSLTALMFLIAGCAAHSGGVAASTKPLTPGGYTELKEVSGEDCQYYLLGFVSSRVRTN